MGKTQTRNLQSCHGDLIELSTLQSCPPGMPLLPSSFLIPRFIPKRYQLYRTTPHHQPAMFVASAICSRPLAPAHAKPSAIPNNPPQQRHCSPHGFTPCKDKPTSKAKVWLALMSSFSTTFCGFGICGHPLVSEYSDAIEDAGGMGSLGRRRDVSGCGMRAAMQMLGLLGSSPLIVPDFDGSRSRGSFVELVVLGYACRKG